MTDAIKRGYWLDYGDGGEGKRGNIATWSSTTNSAEGVYLNHSSALLTGFVITNAKIGIHIQNTPLTGTNVVILGIGGNFLTGPGTGVAGSVGLLIDNSVAESDSSRVMLGAGTTISDYATGVRAEQVTPDIVANDGFGQCCQSDRARPRQSQLRRQRHWHCPWQRRHGFGNNAGIPSHHDHRHGHDFAGLSQLGQLRVSRPRQ